MTLIKEAIVLAGGKGTRLQSVVSDIPKPMAPVAGVPFLEHLLNRLVAYGISHTVLSVGYKSHLIEDYFKSDWKGMSITYAKEESPLGTGGGIALALKFCKTDDVLIFNGDTYFNLDLYKFSRSHIETNSSFTMALKLMDHPDRYGTVEVEGKHVKQFLEKKEGKTQGLINTGVYALNRLKFSKLSFNEVFSFEKEFLEPFVKIWDFNAFVSDAYFIDIGIPDDYFKARARFALPNCDNTWTLFLDRDGVINVRKVDDYIKTPDEFEFLPGVTEALKIAATIFARIVIVTNQQGIGKSLMSENDLEVIHAKMLAEIEESGGRIDAVYFCSALASENNPCRKPAPGMGYQAKRDFPEIDFEKSLMIGDSMSDLEFAQNLEMASAYITAHPYKNELNLTEVQAINLLQLVSYLQEQVKSGFTSAERRLT